MKRRPKALARRLQSIRRHRTRRRPWTEVTGIAEPGYVSAAVIYTEPFAATETAAWLEPDVRRETNSTCSRY
jgi:hypothetical protein